MPRECTASDVTYLVIPTRRRLRPADTVFQKDAMTQAHPPFCRAASLVPGLARFASTALGDMQALITPAVCAALRGQGYAVVDGGLGDVNALRVRDEVLALRPHMHENCTHLVKGGATQLLPKQFILEAELQLAETQARAPLCARLQQDAALRTMLNLLLPGLRLERQAVKLQVNGGGGGCFPLHFDTAQGVDGRRVTAILYLNPGWAPAHGGQLRLYPFPAAHVDVAPLLDRLVLFSSQRMLHRVLPSGAPRCCATTWLSEGPPRGGRPCGGRWRGTRRRR